MVSSPIESLSRQQRRCLEEVARGRSTPEIAFELGIAESTVNGHIEAAVRKLGAPNRRRAAALLIETGHPIPPDELPGQIVPVDPSPLSTAEAAPGRVEEERVAFVLPPPARVSEPNDDQPNPSPMLVLGRIFVIAACLALLLVALDPLIQGASKLANLIQPQFTR